MNGEAGVVLRRILAEDKCGVCNQFLELDKRCFDCDILPTVPSDRRVIEYVSDDDLEISESDDEEDEDEKHQKEFPDHQRCEYCDCCCGCGCCECDDEDNEYMNEPMDCRKCRRTDIPRKLLHWNTTGSYTDYCEECFQEEIEDDRQEAEKRRVIDNEEGIFEIPDFIKPCKTPCVPRPMNGRSWWKNNGFNFDCHCAWKVEKENRNNK